MGKLAAAVDDLGFVLAIETTHAAAHQSRGLCLIEMGRFSQAATHFSLALKHQVHARTIVGNFFQAEGGGRE